DVDQWYHLAVTRSRGTFTIYVNGAPVASEKVEMIIPNPDAPLTIGQAHGIGFFSGLIDEVAIYDRALSPTELRARSRMPAPADEKKTDEVLRFQGNVAVNHSVAFSPDGRIAASGPGDVRRSDGNLSYVEDYTVRLWDVATGREVGTLEGHTGTVSNVAFSSNGSLLVSCGNNDQTVRVWEVSTGKQVQCLQGHTAKVLAVAFLPDG